MKYLMVVFLGTDVLNLTTGETERVIKAFSVPMELVTELRDPQLGPIAYQFIHPVSGVGYQVDAMSVIFAEVRSS